MTSALLLALGVAARADRLILAPRGLITPPNAVQGEMAFRAQGRPDNLSWLNFDIPSQDLGLEVELARSDIGARVRETMSLQYTFTGNLLSDIAPAFSVGVRDLLNRGREGRAYFIAATKTFSLSRAQERLARDFKVHVGYGTSHMDGPWVGAEAKLTLGATAAVEYTARKFDASLALPVGRHLQLKAYTLGGRPYYGASLLIRR